MFKASLWSGHLPVNCAAAFGPEVSDCVDHETKRILGGPGMEALTGNSRVRTRPFHCFISFHSLKVE